MRTGFALAAAVILVLFASVARAEIDVVNDPDLRCAAVGLMIAGGEAQEQQTAGTMLSIYYLGRVQGRWPDVDLEEALFQLTTRITPEELDQERVRCGTELRDFGLMLTELGGNLQRRAQEADAGN